MEREKVEEKKAEGNGRTVKITKTRRKHER